MTPKAPKKKWAWQWEFDTASRILAPFGMTVERSFADYEIAKVKGDGVSLVIYPHTVRSTRNQHARVRDNGSKNKERARWVMAALHAGHGLPQPEQDRVKYSCTFHQKNYHNWVKDLGAIP